ncbi:MAG: hypothetical protein HYV38_01795 [Candidatus Levybacteria bacterium]|nr:hypothetical protein [Candidatus Levybacteria bacterium]
MKIIVAHGSPDLDAIASIWFIRKFLPGWMEASVSFVPAGDRIEGALPGEEVKDPIEKIGKDEVIHVDTGLGPLDHHQTSDDKVCAASLTWDFVRSQNPSFDESGAEESERVKHREEAVSRIVKVVVENDHFKDALYPNPTADYYEFLLQGVIDGVKIAKPGNDEYYVEFISECLDAILHNFENRIWAEEEIKKHGQDFQTKWGKALGIETMNDDAIRLAQKMGYILVARKDPRKGYVRIKANPGSKVDLTSTYERLRKMDPKATWFLHVGKKMLLNGSAKNPKVKTSSLRLDDIIGVLKEQKN